MIQIDNCSEFTCNDDQINKLINSLDKNFSIAQLICYFVLKINIEKSRSKSITIEVKKEILDYLFEQYELTGEIELEEYNEIKDCLINFLPEISGKFLEILVAKIGPFTELSECNYDKCFESKVYHESINSNHNFDVIFFDKISTQYIESKNRIQIDTLTEFHECKNNICNWLPCNMREFFCLPKYNDAKNKLLFIKKVHKITKHDGRFYMPTFAYNVRARQECLDRNKYSFIKIINIEDLLQKISN